MREWIISDTNYESDIINPKLAVSPWCGHRNFIYDYFKYIKPQKVVELGTHYGCSFFAMCQSMKDNKLDNELIAIDTWQGDVQAGFYGNEVWEIVNQTKNKYFAEENTRFMRMYFNEAVNEFADETFDLIHIDGLHTYEAVTEDFATWLPKLKKNGVMLFHDVASKLKYGTNRFWEEIKEQYEYYFEFEHSWGLGILFPKGNAIYKQMMEENFEDKLQIYSYKALYQYETIKTTDLSNMADERYEAIQKQSKMIDERDAVIEVQKKLVEEKDAGIQRQTQMIDERDAVIEAQKKLVEEKDAGIQRQTQMIDERDAVIEAQKKLVEEKDAGIQRQTQMIDERDAAIEAQKKLIEEKEERIKNQEQKISKLEDELNKLNDALEKHSVLSKIILSDK